MSQQQLEAGLGSSQVRRLGTVVGVWAHPDDEAYLSAGLMAAAVDAGNRVVCVTATRGELGTSDPARWPPTRLAHAPSARAAHVARHARRRQPRLAALPRRKLSRRRPDRGHEDDPASARRRRRGHGHHLRRRRHDRTPDHIAVGKWATAAAARARRRPRLLYATKTTEWRNRYADLHRRLPIFGPDGPPAVAPADLALALELRGAALDRKIAALLAHASQTADLIPMMGEDTYHLWAADEYFVEGNLLPRACRRWTEPKSRARQPSCLRFATWSPSMNAGAGFASSNTSPTRGESSRTKTEADRDVRRVGQLDTARHPGPSR